MLRRIACLLTSAALFSCSTVFAVGHNVPMTSNLSPYLHLTRNEFLLNDSFPVYHKLVRPRVDPIQNRLSPTLSPYLHLKRKNVSPWFPFYQQVVRPTLQRHRASEIERRTIGLRRKLSRSHEMVLSNAARRSTTGIVRPRAAATAPARPVQLTGLQSWRTAVTRSGPRSSLPIGHVNHVSLRSANLHAPTNRSVRTALNSRDFGLR